MEAHGVMRVVVLILGALDPRQRSVANCLFVAISEA
jgi:hypothetical protein